MNKYFIVFVFSLLITITLYGYPDDFEEVHEQFDVSPDKPFIVILDVDAGEIVVKKGSESSDCHVHLKYPQKECRSDIKFYEEKNRLKVSLDKRNWRDWSHDSDEDDWAVVEITLPHGVEIILDTRLKAGEMSLSLGGLRLKEFSLSNWAGEVEVRFEEPNKVTMDFMDIDTKVGELDLIRLGNARFIRADINSGIGEIDIDFTGVLESDSRARVDLDIGEATVLVPEDIGIRMSIGGSLGFLSQKNIDDSFYKRGRYYYSRDYEDQDERFSLRITPGLGELTIDQE